jgi:hypothetical protein
VFHILAALSGADLKEAGNLDQNQLNDACGTDAKLPPNLTLKPCTRLKFGNGLPEMLTGAGSPCSPG